jgi:hypothetical protein
VVLAFRYREVVQDLFLDFCLELKYRKIRRAMYSGRQKFYLKVGFNG